MSDNYDSTRLIYQSVLKSISAYHNKYNNFILLGNGTNSIILLVLVAMILPLWSIYKSIRPHQLPKSLPGPKSYPLVGMLPYAIKHWDKWPYELIRLSQKFGKTFAGGVPNMPGLNGAFFYIIDEANVRHVLSTNFENYEKGLSFRAVYGDFFGVGIFGSDGDQWKVHRRIASNMFSRNLLRRTTEVTLQKLHLVADILKISSKNSTNVDIQDIFYRMTFDTTSFTAFGCNMNSLLSLDGVHSFAAAFDEMQFLVHSRILDPLFQVKRFMCLGYRERRIAELKKMLSHEIKNIIYNRQCSEKKNVHDILGRIINHDKIKCTLSEDELCDFVMNILIAGRDTTACALSWTFYELTKYPCVVQKIIREVEQVCASIANSLPDYSYDTICKLRYTHAVVMEVLRLHPSVPVNHKYAINDDVLPDGTFIPSGAAVSWLPIAMGHSEKIWGDDALQFNPDRFFNMKEPSPFKYPVFNAGPRTCLGKPLALMTIKLTLAYLLPRFDFVDKFSHSGSCNWKMVLSMKDGFFVDVNEKKS